VTTNDRLITVRFFLRMRELASWIRRGHSGSRSKREVESQGGHEIVDRVLLDDRHPDLERDVEKVTELLADPGVEGQEKAPRLARRRVAEVPADVGA
jgi:hypothetical protein